MLVLLAAIDQADRARVHGSEVGEMTRPDLQLRDRRRAGDGISGIGHLLASAVGVTNAARQWTTRTGVFSSTFS